MRDPMDGYDLWLQSQIPDEGDENYVTDCCVEAVEPGKISFNNYGDPLPVVCPGCGEESALSAHDPYEREQDPDDYYDAAYESQVAGDMYENYLFNR
jgi:hypothetical protein